MSELNKDKQIEEMAKALCEHCNDDGTCFHDGKPCDLQCKSATDARFIYDKGYRKASEVASEIIGEVEELVNKHMGILELIELCTPSVAAGGKHAFNKVLECLAKLKKKYTEGEG